MYNYNPKCDLKSVTKILVGDSKLKTRSRHPLPNDIAEDSLVFESRFESGNLMRAVRITETYYELHLRPDLYTAKHCQWFYFRVGNMKKDLEYKFSLVNFSKSDSQYSVGMKPVLYSAKEAKRTGVGWIRTGDIIRYFKDTSTGIGEPGRYVMSLSVVFPHSEDEVYLAHCYQYRNIMDFVLKTCNEGGGVFQAAN